MTELEIAYRDEDGILRRTDLWANFCMHHKGSEQQTPSIILDALKEWGAQMEDFHLVFESDADAVKFKLRWA